jgi:50S ribosomal protein L16 3-hydroxylase
MLKQAHQQLGKLGGRAQDVVIFLGEHLSEPKPSVWFTPVERPLSLERFSTAVGSKALRLSRQSRMLYRDKYIFINGESLQAGGADRLILQGLADNRALVAGSANAGSADLVETLYDWYQQGWIRFL